MCYASVWSSDNTLWLQFGNDPLTLDGLQRCGVMQPINYSIIQTKGSISQYSQKWDKDVKNSRLRSVWLWFLRANDRNSYSSEGSDSLQTNSVMFWWGLVWDDHLKYLIINAHEVMFRFFQKRKTLMNVFLVCCIGVRLRNTEDCTSGAMPHVLMMLCNLWFLLWTCNIIKKFFALL